MTESWYRVEVRGGRVVSVVQVEAAGTDEGGVFFVRASTDVAARSLGHAAFNEYCRLRRKRARDAARAKGLCRCGRPLDSGGRQCSRCCDNSNRSKERAAARERGEVVAPPNWAATRERRAVADAARARLLILEEVSRAFNRRRAQPWSFEAWLTNEIKKAKGEAAA